MEVGIGTEWVVDASGCEPSALRNLETLRALFARVVSDLDLRPAAEPLWKTFAGTGGVTGMVLLAESHLTIHTFPEHRHAAINLYCCTPRPAFAWRETLAERLGAAHVVVRQIERAGATSDSPGGNR